MTRFLTSVVLLLVVIASTHRVDANIAPSGSAVFDAVASAVTTVGNSNVAKEVITDAKNAAKQTIVRVSNTSPADVANKVASTMAKAEKVYHNAKKAYGFAKTATATAKKVVNTAKAIGSQVSTTLKQASRTPAAGGANLRSAV